MAEGTRKLSWVPFIRALISFMRVQHLPRAPPPHMLILKVRISTQEFGGDVNIQSMTIVKTNEGFLNTSFGAN